MQGGELIMVEVWRARTAPRAAQEKNQASSACLMPSTFMLGPPPSDRTANPDEYQIQVTSRLHAGLHDSRRRWACFSTA